MVDRLDLRRVLNELAFRQAGYFSAAQARERGFSYQAQKYHVDRGNWVRVDRGLFRLPEWPSDADDSYARWSVWSDGRGVISHQSAAAVHDLGDLDPGQVHLTVSTWTRKRASGVVLHHADLGPGDVESRPTYRVTTPLRTILDLSAGPIPQEQLSVVVEDALGRQAVTATALRRVMDGFGARAALRLERALTAVTA
jgi:predicted transcriptional regulator of viral defense system